MDSFQKLILSLMVLVKHFVVGNADSWSVYNKAVSVRCSAMCLNKFGQQEPPNEEMSGYNLYRPYNCENRKCRLALLPCQWTRKSEEECLRDCPSLECKDTCYLLQFIKSQTPRTTTIEELEDRFPSSQMSSDLEIICQQDQMWDNIYMYTTMFIRWKLPTSPNSSARGPVIALISMKSDSGQSWHLVANTSQPIFSVKLSYDSKYAFHVTAFNHMGLTGTGSTGWIQPKPHKGKLEPVKKLEVLSQFLEGNSISARIHWVPPEAGSCFHKLKWLSASSGPVLKNLMVCPEPEYILRNLAFSERYSVSLVSTSRRFDRDSNPVSITFVTKSCLELTHFNYSKCGPEAPQNFKFRVLSVSENSSNIFVTWQSPLHLSLENNILGYYLTWKKIVPILEAPFENPENGSIELDRHNLSCLLRGVRPASNYLISVSAISEGGVGQPAKIIAG